MSSRKHLTALAVLTGLVGLGCADMDNPTALADLDPDTEFEISMTRVETLEEVEIHVHPTQDGAPLEMRQSQLEIQHAAGGPIRTVEMHPEGDGYAAHVTFYEEGEHHLHFMGMPERHRLMTELGESEVDVHLQHREIGPYWVELSAGTEAITEGGTRHLHVLVHDLLGDGTRGAAVGGLEIELMLHAPDGHETPMTAVEEESGEYEAEGTFTHSGLYELHVEIHLGAEHLEGEFHIPVLALEEPDGDHDDDTGGDGHGH